MLPKKVKKYPKYAKIVKRGTIYRNIKSGHFVQFVENGKIVWRLKSNNNFY